MCGYSLLYMYIYRDIKAETRDLSCGCDCCPLSSPKLPRSQAKESEANYSTCLTGKYYLPGTRTAQGLAEIRMLL